MATMYPAEISPETTSDAERLLFREFERQLPNEVVVFHSVAWMARDRHREHHGECDFLVAHPRAGLIAIEVKGGTIEGEWGAEKWTSISRGGHLSSIKNPVGQVDRARWNLTEALRISPTTRAHSYPEIMRCLAFPDMLVGANRFGLGVDAPMILDSSSLSDLAGFVRRILGEPGPNVISSAAMSAMRDLIAPTVSISRPGLGYSLKQGEQRIIELTEEQYQVLGFLQHHRQAVINGCAGSGKTLLAVEKALRLARDGYSVLLTCFNKNLAAWMRSIVYRQPAQVASSITVTNYHDLAVHLCDEAGVATQVASATQDYWNEGLANDLATAIPLIDTRYDAIVVDEGQDFNASWWITLQDLLSSPRGVFYIFQDEQQAIYRQERALPVDAAPFALTANIRSTAAIHEEVARYYPGTPKPTSRGPAGQQIEFVPISRGSVRQTLANIVRRLVGVEGLRPDQIVILTPHGSAHSAIANGQLAEGLSLTRANASADRDIRVSTIHAFKGLESDVVILAETDSLAARPDGSMLTYVALSRAKHHLIVIGDLPAATPAPQMAQ